MMQVTPEMLELMRYGFFFCIYVEIHCPNDGEFRVAMNDFEYSPQIRCPTCAVPREATLLAEGFTQILGTWERVAAPLRTTTRLCLLAEVDEAARYRREQRRGKECAHHYRKNGRLAVSVDAEGESRHFLRSRIAGPITTGS